MALNEIDIINVTQYWLQEAEEAFGVAEHLFHNEDFSYALFFGHLAVEKILKAIYVRRKKEHAPPIHNLHRLAKLADISLDTNQADMLLLVTSFNIEARYPDIKRTFRKKCTKQFTQDQLQKIKGLFSWLKNLT